MFSSALSADIKTMRPGPIAGRYPQRCSQEDGWLDGALNALKGKLIRLTLVNRTALPRVAATIGRRADALTGLDNTAITALLITLRRHFHRRGLVPGLCVQSFALIRELAMRTIRLRHYDSQVMAGWVMLQGRLAEMETGEGKTLAATLAAATAGLAGIPVHVITVNEYLVKRDAEAMGPLYQALGLTVGYVTQDMPPDRRRAGYGCDITYCTNKQVAFDYLRDRLLLGNTPGQLRLQLESAYSDNNRLGQFLLRGLCYAIVDEADSVLLDEARTPLIITRNTDDPAQHAVYLQALNLAKGMERGHDFFLDPAQHRVELSLAGQQKLAGLHQSPRGLHRSPKGGLQNTRQREELVCRALHALHLLHRDRDYLVQGDKVMIIDANTGRTMPDRSWERGLHQLVETKEAVPLTGIRDPLGRLTFQNFFRRYLHLGGMTGTAREVRSELWSVYRLRVREIPLHRPSRRKELPPKVYPRAKEKWAAVVTGVKAMQRQGRPVLIGTGSVADSEFLSRQLTVKKIPHQVLNARQDKEEARVVAAAGKEKQVTVATNMAGRGTDIPLAHGVANLGGLHVIATCRNQAKRIDRQLYGRCARQGDPGSFQVVLSLEDELVRQNCHPTLIKFLNRPGAKNSLFHGKLNRFIIRQAQRGIERRHREARRALLQYDRQTGRLLTFSGHLE
ncbi:MAG: prepilin peptidase [Desulfobacterales bacterium]|nr:prepilin peptidase [Desulfobacterales bacterium]